MGALIHKFLIRTIGIVVLPLGFFILYVFDNLGSLGFWEFVMPLLAVGTWVALCFLNIWGRVGWVLLLVSAIGKHITYFVCNWDDARGLAEIDQYRNHFSEISAETIFWNFIDVWFFLVIGIYLFLPPVSRIFRENK